jgi:hypothetical protein
VGANLQPLDQEAKAICTTVPLFQYDNRAEKDKVGEKMAMTHFLHFIHKFMKLLMNFV